MNKIKYKFKTRWREFIDYDKCNPYAEANIKFKPDEIFDQLPKFYFTAFYPYRNHMKNNEIRRNRLLLRRKYGADGKYDGIIKELDRLNRMGISSIPYGLYHDLRFIEDNMKGIGRKQRKPSPLIERIPIIRKNNVEKAAKVIEYRIKYINTFFEQFFSKINAGNIDIMLANVVFSVESLVMTRGKIDFQFEGYNIGNIEVGKDGITAVETYRDDEETDQYLNIMMRDTVDGIPIMDFVVQCYKEEKASILSKVREIKNIIRNRNN